MQSRDLPTVLEADDSAAVLLRQEGDEAAWGAAHRALAACEEKGGRRAWETRAHGIGAWWWWWWRFGWSPM